MNECVDWNIQHSLGIWSLILLFFIINVCLNVQTCILNIFT